MEESMKTKYAVGRQAGVIGLICICLVLSTAFAPTGASTYWGPWMFSPPEPPPLVRLTGALFPVQDKGELTGLYNLPIFIGAQTWIFHVEKAQSLTGSIQGSSLLNELFPMRLRFVGSKDVLRQIAAQAGPARTLTLTGRLYVSHNWLLVSSVEEAGDESFLKVLRILGSPSVPLVGRNSILGESGCMHPVCPGKNCIHGRKCRP
jgi:hypothetical protein